MELLTVFGGEPILTLFPFEIDFLGVRGGDFLAASLTSAAMLNTRFSFLFILYTIRK